MLRGLQPNILAGTIVAGLMLSFGVISPHVHFHGAHDAAPGPLEISVHPMGPDPEHAPDHDGHDDSRLLDQCSIEFYRTRVHSGANVAAPGPAVIAYHAGINLLLSDGIWLCRTESKPPGVKPPYFPCDPRSPPRFSL